MPAYVIGHVNPDTDSVAAAMGYAWYLNEKEGGDFVPARAGAVNSQTAWILKRLDLEPPLLLGDASPRFQSVLHRLDTTLPDTPLQDAWAIASRTWGVAPVVDTEGIPFGLITGASLFAYLSEIIGPDPQTEEGALPRVLAAPSRDACRRDVPTVKVGARIRDFLPRFLREEGDTFFVVDDKGLYLGVCRQREILNPPRLKIILVDHNEPSQALPNLEDADLLEILDHHRLGNPSTRLPIRFVADTVGSTSTLVSERIAEAGLSAPPQVAGMLLAGLLSDTLTLTSPTTTPRDHKAAERLARWAFVHQGPLAGETVDSYGTQILGAGGALSSRQPEEIVGTDLKLYEEGGYRFAIAQVEVTDLGQVSALVTPLATALRALRDVRGLHFAMLLVTDVVRGTSRLLLTELPPELGDLPYPRAPDNTRMAEGVVSRKKQLLPVVLGLIEK